jgi:hypothetical protein
MVNIALTMRFRLASVARFEAVEPPSTAMMKPREVVRAGQIEDGVDEVLGNAGFAIGGQSPEEGPSLLASGSIGVSMTPGATAFT